MSQRRRRQPGATSSQEEEEESVVWSENSDIESTDTEEGAVTPDVPSEAEEPVKEPEEEEEEGDEPGEEEEVAANQGATDEVFEEGNKSPAKEGTSEGEDDKGEEEDEVEGEDGEEDEKSDEESPTHVPKRGNFYQHDDRNYVDPKDDGEGEGRRGGRRAPRIDSKGRQWGGKNDKKWAHDMFNPEEQKPKEEWEKMKGRGGRSKRGGGRGGQRRDRDSRDDNKDENREDRGGLERGNRDRNKPRTRTDRRPEDRRPDDRRSDDRRSDDRRSDDRRPDDRRPEERRYDHPKERLPSDTQADAPKPKPRAKDGGIGRGRKGSNTDENGPSAVGGLSSYRRRSETEEQRDSYRRKDYNTEPRPLDNGDRYGDKKKARKPEAREPREPRESREPRELRESRRRDARGDDTDRPHYPEDRYYEDAARPYTETGGSNRRRGGGSSRRRGSDRRDPGDAPAYYYDEEPDMSPPPRHSRRRYDSDKYRDYAEAPIKDRTGSRSNDSDEIWKQIEQLKLDIRKVQQTEATVVGRGRARKVSPPEGVKPAGHPKYPTSQTMETEVVTTKPKRYSQRSKQIDPAALREALSSMTEQQHPEYSHYASYPAESYGNQGYYPPAEPAPQPDTYTDTQALQHMMMLQNMNYNAGSDMAMMNAHQQHLLNAQFYQHLLQQQQQQQQQQQGGYMYPPHATEHTRQPGSGGSSKHRTKAIPIVDPNAPPPKSHKT